jgi:hypothetical protein
VKTQKQSEAAVEKTEADAPVEPQAPEASEKEAPVEAPVEAPEVVESLSASFVPRGCDRVIVAIRTGAHVVIGERGYETADPFEIDALDAHDHVQRKGA